MALLHDILKWTETRPAWQRDAARRLLQKGDGLTEQDYTELYALMKAENEIEKPTEFAALRAQPLATEHIPAESESDETVILKSLRNLENVNRIAPNQTIDFGKTGITVIYGGNASGKSGYVRVMKRACRARDQSEQILPNAHDAAFASSIPAAKFDIEVAGVTEEIAWSCGVTPPEKLSKIAVFDSKCARSYLLEEKDVAYLPYGLDIVENLANKVLPKLSKMLESEIHAINTDARQFQHPPNGADAETEVGRQLRALTADSDIAKIKHLGTLSQEETARFGQLKESLGENEPAKKADELLVSAHRLKKFATIIERSLSRVDDQAVKELQKVCAEKIDAESSEKNAAALLHAGKPLLDGTGEQVWKLLFEAARRYSIEIAYPGKDFPNLTDDAVCPLCQDPLSPVAKKRLVRFEEYVKNDVAEATEKKRGKFRAAKGELVNADVRFMGDTAMIEEIRNLDHTLCQILASFENGLEKRRQSVLGSFANSTSIAVSALPKDPRPKIRQLAARQLRKSRAFSRAANEQKRHALNAERNDLSARHKLSVILESVVALFERMQKKAALNKCAPSLQTRGISTQSKEFASIAITDALKSALDKEFKTLGIGYVKTRLKERSERGRTFHQLLLDLPRKNKLDEILSEGEQRAIAIGAFFAELSLGNHSCGIVFDDPVSSLDHWRRQYIAKRLTEEANIRQVIVFTHDTSFLGQLRDEIEQQSIPNSMMFLEWSGDYAGSVCPGLPWEHKSCRDRIDRLEKAQRGLPSPWPQYPSESDSAIMRNLYDRLRATLERAIQDVVFNGVIQRYRDWIKVSRLAQVVGFDSSEFEAIHKLHKKCSNVTTAHDPASAKSASVPTASDLRDDIDALKYVIKQIRRRRNGVAARK